MNRLAMQRRGVMAVLAILSVAACVAGGAYEVSVADLCGGEIRDMAVCPTTSAVYAAVSSGLWGSRDLGETWQRLGPGGRSIAVDPKRPNILYSAGQRELFESTDGGKTWTSILKARLGQGSVKVDPAVSDRVLAGGKLSGGTAGLHVSADGGKTWRTVAILGSTHGVRQLSICDVKPSVMYVALMNDGVWKSTDGGQTRRDTHCPDPWDRAVAMSATDPDVVYASGNVSRDGAKTWTPTNTRGAWSIAVHPRHPNVAYFGHVGSPTWMTVNYTTFRQVYGCRGSEYSAGEVEGLAIDGKHDIVYIGGATMRKAAKASTGQAEAIESARGIHAIDFTDMKSTRWAVWISSDSRGIHRSADSVTWCQVILGTRGSDSIRSIAPHPAEPMVAYAGHEHAIFKTVNAADAAITGNTVKAARQGIVVYASAGVRLADNRVNLTQPGQGVPILLNACRAVTIAAKQTGIKEIHKPRASGGN